MARKPKAPKGGSWFDHRAFLAWEAVMAVGLFQETMVAWILDQQEVPPMLRVTASVAIVVGTMGGLVIAMRRQAVKRLDQTHKTVRRMVPLPRLLFHLLVLTALFLGYAWLCDEETGALGWVWRTLGLG